MAGYALIEAVKAKKGLTSDNQLALMLGKDRQNISNWKNKEKAKPDTESILDLMILGDIDAKEAKRLLQGGYTSLSLILMTAMGCTSLFYWSYISQGLYIMLNSKLFRLWQRYIPKHYPIPIHNMSPRCFRTGASTV
jgi:hypothetical protein